MTNEATVIYNENIISEGRKTDEISSPSLAKFGKGENVATKVLLRICKALDFDDFSQIVEIEKEA